MPRTIFAEPFNRCPNSSWIGSYVELRAFERTKTIEHPRYGRVVCVEAAQEQREWRRLIDAEATAYQEMINGPLPTATALPADATPTLYSTAAL
ncbi:MAG: hypothetical protein WBM08_09360 [Prochlorococcaceae cyanobacterium]